MAEDKPEFITKDEVIELINTGINERQEETLEKIRDEVKTEYETILTELTKRIETLESQIKEKDDKEAEDDKTPADDKKEPEPEPVDKGFNADEIVEKTIQKIFGNASNDGLNVKYTDKGFEFESPSKDKKEDVPAGSDKIVDKKFTISEIAKII